MRRWTGNLRTGEAKPLASDGIRSHLATLNRPMNSGFSDPNNHVPEVSPDDGWDDAEGAGNELPSTTTATVLPPRRKVADRSSDTEVAEPGLRIGSNPVRAGLDDSADSASRLQVQEISANVIRLEQEIQPPPRVERQIVFHERPVQQKGGGKPRGENREWGKSLRHPVRWIAAAGAGVAAIVILSMMMLPSINAPNKPREQAAAAVMPEEETSRDLEAINAMMVKQPEAIQLFRAYAQAAHPDEILPMIRDGAALEKTLRAHWTPLNLSKRWAPDMNSSWTILTPDGKPHGLLEGTLPDGEIFSAYIVPVEGRILLDWKATSAFSTASFSELEKGIGDSSEIRGVVSPATFYSATLPESDYHSYRCVSPDNQSLIWCYVRRGTLEEAHISPHFKTGEIVRDGNGPRRMTLRLERGPEGSQPNQWIIGEMLHIGWIKP
jgi:hypothetical protein